MGDFTTQMHDYVAYTSIGPSTVRGQRSPGLAKVLREALTKVRLEKFLSCQPKDFVKLLDDETKRIVKAMPPNARRWGMARKVLNIFLRGATYNTFLRREFRLQRVEACLELPLDSITVDGLRERSDARSLPAWPGLKHLTQTVSDQYQTRATEIATNMKIHRVHLDIYLWLDR